MRFIKIKAIILLFAVFPLILATMPSILSVHGSNSTGTPLSSNSLPYWAAAKVVSTDSTVDSLNPCLGVGPDGTVHVVWDEVGFGICYRRCLPSTGWKATKVVSSTGSDPSLAVGSDGTVHIVWEDVGVYYRSYAPRKGWTNVRVVSAEGYDPSVAVGSDGAVHVAWGAWLEGAWNIVYRKFRPNGTWDPPEVVDTAPRAYSDHTGPSLGVGPDRTIHITWHGDVNPITGIYYSRKERGTGWMDAERFTGAVCMNPSLAVGSDGTVHIAWQWQWEDDTAILYRKHAPSTGWASIETISWAGSNPSIAIGPKTTIHLAWVENSNIIYKSYLPGIGWTIAEVVSRESTDDSWSPSLAVRPDGTAHIVWVDNTDYLGSGNDADIFYKKLIRGNYVLGVIDQVDIGNPESEIGHSLWGWGPVMGPSLWYGCYRYAWYPGEGTGTWDRAGTVTLYRRAGSVIKDLYLKAVSDYRQQSVDVYVRVSWGRGWTAWKKIYNYVPEPYTQATVRIPLPESWKFAAKVNVAIIPTGEISNSASGGVWYIQLAGYIRG